MLLLLLMCCKIKQKNCNLKTFWIFSISHRNIPSRFVFSGIYKEGVPQTYDTPSFLFLPRTRVLL